MYAYFDYTGIKCSMLLEHEHRIETHFHKQQIHKIKHPISTYSLIRRNRKPLAQSQENVLEITNPLIFQALFNSKLITEFYTECFSGYPNITSKFRTIAILKTSANKMI
jgi:hypothetical protein